MKRGSAQRLGHGKVFKVPAGIRTQELRKLEFKDVPISNDDPSDNLLHTGNLPAWPPPPGKDGPMKEPGTPGPDFTGGYPTRTAYEATIQPVMAPAAMDLVMLLRHRQPPLRDSGFSYLELGCGRGVTLIALAAACPESRFLGIDFMPEHIAWAQRLAREAGIANIAFEDADFATLARRDPPPERFDYATLHGVYTWVSPDNRANVIRILDRWLSPGAAVYVGCNAMPGWAAGLPIRRIFRDLLGAGVPSPEHVDAARAAVELWLARPGMEAVKALWKRLATLPNAYLLHEFGGAHGGAVWSIELIEGMAAARLDHVGAASLMENFDELHFDDATREFLLGAGAAGFGTTARDLVTGRSFLMEIFSRGAPALTEVQSSAALSRLQIEAVEPVLSAEKAAISQGTYRGLDDAVADRLAALLKSGPRPMGEVAAASGLEPTDGLQALLVMLASGRARIVRPDAVAAAARQAAERFNAVARRRHDQGAPLPCMVSPRLGTGVPVGDEEREAALGRGKKEDRLALRRLGIKTVSPGRARKTG